MLALILAAIALTPGAGATRPNPNACQHVPRPIYFRLCTHPYSERGGAPAAPVQR